jgi:hypothetical protein
MRLLALFAFLALAAPASAGQLLVVGRDGTLAGPRHVKARATRAAGCRVPARTPMAALLATRLEVKVRDYGGCDPGGLYVRSVAGQAERGADGWVYKRTHDTPSVGAADVSQRGHRALWFWCRYGANGCQRTLDARAIRTSGGVEVTVTAYDDHGSGVRAEGATVRCGGVTGKTGDIGIVTLNADCRRVVATQKGRVRSFPVPVR